MNKDKKLLLQLLLVFALIAAAGCGFGSFAAHAAPGDGGKVLYAPVKEEGKKDPGVNGSIVTSYGEDEREEKKAPVYTPVSTPVTDPYSRFGKGRLTMLANRDTDAQSLSVIIENGEGGLIVVDGGWEENGESLFRELEKRGGHVCAWLITHPHKDHALALASVLKEHGSELTIDGIYYHFFEDAWYEANDRECAEVIPVLKEAFAGVDPAVLHGDIRAGDVIEAGPALIQVLNDPYAHSTDCGNNSCVTYMVSLNGTNTVFLGDLGLAAGASMMQDVDLRGLKCDICQVAHHGQSAVSYSFYQQLAPSVFLWPTPGWLWNNDGGSGPGSGKWGAIETTKKWQTGLLIREYYVAKDGDQVIE